MGKQSDGPGVTIGCSMIDLKFRHDFRLSDFSLSQPGPAKRCSQSASGLRQRNFFAISGFNKELEASH